MSPALMPKRHRGFSMIELLLVAFMLGIGLLGLAALVTMTIRSETSGRQREVAAVLAGNVLETLVGDGRQSMILRMNGQAVTATSFRLAGAVDDAVNAFSANDESGTAQTTFDLMGRPSAANPVFRVNWVRRANKTGAPAATAQTAGAEVVVNVRWDEPLPSGATVQKWISVSRYVSY